MSPHQQRVVDEKRELDTKLDALQNFFRTAVFATLDAGEQGRMRRQATIMIALSTVLGERIAHF